MKIIDEQDRKKLCEGRNFQMGFAFCKKVGTAYHTVQPISPCKDYLNDVIWSEKTGKDITCCGLKYSKQDIYNKGTTYLAFKICPSFYLMSRPDDKGYSLNSEALKKDVENLRKNYKNIQVVLNWFEDKLKKPHSVIGMSDDKETYLVKVPEFWTSRLYLVSLYSLLIRMSQFYDGNGSVGKFLDKFSNNMDLMLWTAATKRVKAILKGELPAQDFKETDPSSSVHSNGGICGFTGFKNLKTTQDVEGVAEYEEL